MNKRIVYKNNDGSCCIIVPADCGLSIEEIAMKDVPVGADFRIIDVDKLPADRIFRNAWTDDFDTDTVDIDIARAKLIKLDMMRAIRKPLLAQYDIDFMKSIEIGDDDLKKDIVTKKQILRDITTLELPDDIEELKAFMPDCLL